MVRLGAVGGVLEVVWRVCCERAVAREGGRGMELFIVE